MIGRKVEQKMSGLQTQTKADKIVWILRKR